MEILPHGIVLFHNSSDFWDKCHGFDKIIFIPLKQDSFISLLVKYFQSSSFIYCIAFLFQEVFEMVPFHFDIFIKPFFLAFRFTIFKPYFRPFSSSSTYWLT